jgi:hypothetical protein
LIASLAVVTSKPRRCCGYDPLRAPKHHATQPDYRIPKVDSSLKC